MRCTLLSVLLSTPLLGQTLVVPAHFAATEGSRATANGLGTTASPSTILLVLDELQGTPRTIKSVAFRRDGVTSTVFGGFTVLVNVFASTAATTGATVSATFADNHGANKTQIAAFAPVSFPATSSSHYGEPFEYRIPFSQPYAYDGNGPLCLEVQVTSRTNASSVTLDMASSPSNNPTTQVRSTGTGCKATGHSSAALMNGSASTKWTTGTVTLSYNGSRLPPSSVILLGVGANKESLGGVPLPLELPGTASAPSGACRIYNDFIVTVPALTTATGSTTLNLPIAVIAAYNGLTAYAQFIAVDAAANNFGVVLTNQVTHHLVAPYTSVPAGWVYSNNTTGPAGTARPNEVPVVQLEM